MIKANTYKLLWLAGLLLLLGDKGWAQTLPTDGVDARTDAASLSRLLGSPDAHQRQRAAEALAQLAATDQKKLIDGYYLQEKNKTVRLALEWAMYRIGREEALFQIVHHLNSSRQEQAIGYLSQLDSPELLYPFLLRGDNKPKVTVGLIEALARLGNGETVERLQKFRDSFAPGVAAAAEKAIDSIEARTSEARPKPTGRPRTISRPGQN